MSAYSKCSEHVSCYFYCFLHEVFIQIYFRQKRDYTRLRFKTFPIILKINPHIFAGPFRNPYTSSPNQSFSSLLLFVFFLCFVLFYIQLLWNCLCFLEQAKLFPDLGETFIRPAVPSAQIPTTAVHSTSPSVLTVLLTLYIRQGGLPRGLHAGSRPVLHGVALSLPLQHSPREQLWLACHGLAHVT